jgi:hypothetical protein
MLNVENLPGPLCVVRLNVILQSVVAPFEINTPNSRTLTCVL